MRVGVLICIFIVALWGESTAQNLIPNGSFEVKLSCPDDYVGYYREQYVRYWDSPNTGTPDYFHACSKKCGVPINWVGNADAVDGEAYMGIIGCLLQSDPNQISYREYLRTKLIRPLEAGKTYYAEMYVRLALSCNTACSGMGMFFSNSNMQSQRNYNYPVKADITISPNSIIRNKEAWTKVCGTFKANGDENYLIIGNFQSNQEMEYEALDENFISTLSISPMAYYYVDGVMVKELSPELLASCETMEEALPLGEFKGELTPEVSMVLKQLFFETDKAIIKTESYHQLNQLVLALKKQPGTKIVISGHTDIVGTQEYNQTLSEKRAQAVMYYLMNKGISKFRMKSQGFGSSKPIGDNNTEEGKQLNRRVEIQVEL